MVFLITRVVPERKRNLILSLSIGAIALFCFAAFLTNIASVNPGTGLMSNSVRFGALFFTGAGFYLLRRHIRLSHGTAALLCIVVFATVAWRPLFVTAFWLSLPYLILYLAYLPGGAIRRFNGLGDYSYGLYVLAFPVQQLLVWHWPSIGPWALFLAAMMLTLPLAILSWHLVERPMLSIKPPSPGSHSRASIIR